MAEAKIKQPRKLVKWLFWRIPVALMVLCAVLIVALKIVEGYPDPLRQGFEQYLTQATGRNATIGVLEEIKFFPNFILQANNITAHNRANAAEIDLEIEQVKINAPFSSVFFARRKINEFTLKNLTAQKNMFGPKEMMIDTADIVLREEGDNPGSFIVAQGRYGVDDFYLEAQLEAGKYNYKIPVNLPFLIQVGTYSVASSFKRKMSYVALENLIFSVSDQDSIPQDYIFVKDKSINQNNPLSCILNEENLKNCDKYLSTETVGEEK
jgi:hypothetical protein